MPKLSRMERNKQLHSQIDQQNQADAKSAAPAVSEKPVSQGVRLAAPGKAEVKKETAPAADSTNDVMDSLLGEVRQYNREKGAVITDDTQMQILYDLSEENAQEKRASHLETMEVNEQAGGTTRNIYPSSFSEIRQPVREISLEQASYLFADEPAASQDDGLDVLALGKTGVQPVTVIEEKEQISIEEPVVSIEKEPAKRTEPAVKTAKAKKQVKKAQSEARSSESAVQEKPAKKVKTEKPAAEVEKPEKSSGSSAANIVMAVITVILLVLIALTVYWMFKVGIF